MNADRNGVPTFVFPRAARPIPEYYKQLGSSDLEAALKDVDCQTPKVYRAAATDNSFLLDFGVDDAWALFSPSRTNVESLLRAKRPESLATRWINIYNPDSSSDVVEAIGRHYGFTPRLRALMVSDPGRPSLAIQRPNNHRRTSVFAQKLDRLRHSTDRASKLSAQEIELESPSPEDAPMMDVSHYKIANEIWHYHSFDAGQKYVCIGFNSIHPTEDKIEHCAANSNSRKTGRIVPPGRRLWSWLVLCDDNTIVSIHEDPLRSNHKSAEDSDQQQSTHHAATFRHFIDVFGQLCNPDRDTTLRNPITILPLRIGRAASSQEIAAWPSMLFYYLFDNWYASYSLASRNDQQFGARLDQLVRFPGLWLKRRTCTDFQKRIEMLKRADLGHIDTLHQVGRQLTILKKVYESYSSLIDRLIKRQAKPKTTKDHLEDADTILGPRLSVEAVSRFEGMRSRIKLYALGEIEDCQAEKDALVFMTFNLLAHKESQAVERLTRTTIFLAKVTILFLPVTLMTGYFSVQIQDLQGKYTTATYWVSFAVIIGLSFLAILIFGIVTGTVEGNIVYRSFTRIGLNKILGHGTSEDRAVHNKSRKNA